MKFSRSKKTDDQPSRRTNQDSAVQAPAPSQFRRNQTLSGRQRQADHPESERGKIHHLAARRRKAGGIFLLVLSVIIVLTLLLTQYIARVTISGSSQQLSRPADTVAYEEKVHEYLSINPVERLRFMFNEESLVAFMSESHPEVAELSLRPLRDLTTAQLRVSLRDPIAGWQINNQQYYVDADGVVFQENYFEDPGVQIVDESGISPEQGTAVASARLLSFVGRLVSEAGESGYAVQSVSLPPDSTRQLEVRLKDVKPFIRFTVDRVVGEQVEDMDRSVRYLRDRDRDVEYIDVRVAGRAVYR
tara:strand:+ start:879 stop:1787 length:909 start_codon:yes stop_codon:yes gene_type:complete